MSRSYTFTDSENKIHVLTLQEASQRLEDPAIKKRFENILESSKNKRMKKDGFEPGIQANTGLYAGGRLEYNRQLKELGLVEVGYDFVPQESKGNYNYCQTDDFINAVTEQGVELNESERDAIKSGEYFKD